MTTPAAFAATAALLAEPPRAAMLQALLSGEALTAGELARVAGIGAPAASAHLARLVEGGLVAMHPQGRPRYHRPARAGGSRPRGDAPGGPPPLPPPGLGGGSGGDRAPGGPRRRRRPAPPLAA